MNCDASNLPEKLADLIRRLLSIPEVTYIAVGQLLPFPLMNENQLKVVGEVNGQLTALDKTSYWFHMDGFWNCQNVTLYYHNGVHLNVAGMKKYWLSVQGAIRQGLRLMPKP